ncbi:MAG: P1 family peptidase [Acidobacteriota bacterium]
MQSLSVGVILTLMTWAGWAQNRYRARDLGIQVGILSPGRMNAITDVEGVGVGHVTLIRGRSIRSGVTAILPHQGNVFLQKVPAAVYVANGFGKLMGTTQIEELGNLETPILLTSTLNVPRVADALLDYMLALPGMEKVRSINPVVGETNDGYLNDIRSRPVGGKEVFRAIQSAGRGPVAEGAVGAGTGTVCYGFKGGIGTSSRVLPSSLGGYTLGVLVQSNFGGVLQIGGAPVGRELGKYYLKDSVGGASDSSADGSCMMVVATDAPIDARNLKRLARRAMLGLAATGGASTNGSGDYVIAFSTAPQLRIPYQSSTRGVGERRLQGARLRNEDLSPLFQAVKEATEEAIYNSLLMATAVTGHQGHSIEALPLDKVFQILKKYHVIPSDQAFPQ